MAARHAVAVLRARLRERGVAPAIGAWLDALWRWAGDHPAAALAIIVALHTVPSLGARELWFSDEVRHGGALQSLLRGGHWMVLYLNGVPYPDKPPVYFWLLALLATVFRSDRPWVFFLAAALSTWALLVATHALARQVGGAGRRASLQAALVLLGATYVGGVAHSTRPDLLFAALITAAHVALYRAWAAERAYGLAAAGFGLAGLAVLTKGPLGLAMPLLASVVFLAWRGRLGRLARPDALLGLVLGVALPLAWLALASVVEGRAFVQSLLVRQIYERATASFAHARPFYHYLLVLPLVWFPWTLALVGRPWVARTGPRGDSDGRVHLWCVVASGLLLLSAISIKLGIYLLPLLPPLAVLTAGALAGVSDDARRRIWTAIALGLTAAAVLLVVFVRWALPALTGAGVASAALMVAVALAVLALRRRGIEPALSALVLGLAVCANATLVLAGPGLDAVMSPRATAEVMRAYAAQGYLPVAHQMLPGIYTYYVGSPILETRRFAALSAVLHQHRKVVVAIGQRDWDRWTARPEGLEIVHRQRLADTETLVFVRAR